VGDGASFPRVALRVEGAAVRLDRNAVRASEARTGWRWSLSELERTRTMRFATVSAALSVITKVEGAAITTPEGRGGECRSKRELAVALVERGIHGAAVGAQSAS
jgi:hypothetical protein